MFDSIQKTLPVKVDQNMQRTQNMDFGNFCKRWLETDRFLATADVNC